MLVPPSATQRACSVGTAAAKVRAVEDGVVDPDLVDGTQSLVQRWHLAAVHAELTDLLAGVAPGAGRAVVPNRLDQALAAVLDSYGQPGTTLNLEQRATLARLAHEEVTTVEDVVQRALDAYVAAHGRTEDRRGERRC